MSALLGGRKDINYSRNLRFLGLFMVFFCRLDVDCEISYVSTI